MSQGVMVKTCTVAVCALLVGCPYPYTRHPGRELHQWTVDTHECKLVAREGMLAGSMLFLAIELNTRWKICMVDRGWFLPIQK
jgi:hypothetical protein